MGLPLARWRSGVAVPQSDGVGTGSDRSAPSIMRDSHGYYAGIDVSLEFKRLHLSLVAYAVSAGADGWRGGACLGTRAAEFLVDATAAQSSHKPREA